MSYKYRQVYVNLLNACKFGGQFEHLRKYFEHIGKIFGAFKKVSGAFKKVFGAFKKVFGAFKKHLMQMSTYGMNCRHRRASKTQYKDGFHFQGGQPIFSNRSNTKHNEKYQQRL